MSNIRFILLPNIKSYQLGNINISPTFNSVLVNRLVTRRLSLLHRVTLGHEKSFKKRIDYVRCMKSILLLHVLARAFRNTFVFIPAHQVLCASVLCDDLLSEGLVSRRLLREWESEKDGEAHSLFGGWVAEKTWKKNK